MASPDFSKGVMVALYPHPDVAKELAVDGGEVPEELHTTLAFIGTRGEEGLPAEGPIPGLQEAVQEVAQRHQSPEAKVTGLARFMKGDNGTPFVGIVGSHTIHDLQKDLGATLKQRGVPVSDKFPFVPHVTFAYLKDGDSDPLAMDEPKDLNFGHLVLKDGEDRFEYPFLKPVAKTAAMYYRGEGLHTFHIEGEPGQTVCKQPLPRGGDIWAETPPRKHICPVCTLWHDRSITEERREERAEDLAEAKEDFVPLNRADYHKPDHEYVADIGGIPYYIPGCNCNWATNIRSEQAAKNAWQRHVDSINEVARGEKAGEPKPDAFEPKPTKRWGTHLVAEHQWTDLDADDKELEGLHDFLHVAHEGVTKDFRYHLRVDHEVGDEGLYAQSNPEVEVLHEDLHNQLPLSVVCDIGNHGFCHGVRCGCGCHKSVTASWFDHVTAPYQQDAVADPKEDIEPVMPPLYQNQQSIWPDEELESWQRPMRPAELLSNPKTGSQEGDDFSAWEQEQSPMGEDGGTILNAVCPECGERDGHGTEDAYRCNSCGEYSSLNPFEGGWKND